MAKAHVYKRDHINTDEIIPARYLNTDNEAELAKHCMEDLDKDFVTKVKPGDVIVAGDDFGCGSSREHAVWALAQDGYQVIIAPRKERDGDRVNAFADIFKTNATKNGLLVVELSEAEVDVIFELVRANLGLQATVDLVEQTVEIHASTAEVFRFEIEKGDKAQLINGHDDIDLTLKYESDITRFEETHDPYL